MKLKPYRQRLKTELRKIQRSMDFVYERYIKEERVGEPDFEAFSTIYQELGLAWEYLGLQCEHWEGYRNIRGGKQACKICGKLKDAPVYQILLPADRGKKIGRKSRPTSKRAFKNKTEARILEDSIRFHGARLDVDVHNSYDSDLFRPEMDIKIAAERIVTLKEDGVECSVSEHTVTLKVVPRPRGKAEEPPYGAFPHEMRKKELKRVPVLLRTNGKGDFTGLTVFRGKRKSGNPA